MKKILLTVAGFDPTSGAGISLDLRVFQSAGFQGMAVLTSLTEQNTEEVKKIYCLTPEFVKAQYETLRKDVSFSGIKVGMLGSGKNISVIKQILENNPKIPRVVDPVFKSSSGTWLLEPESIPDYISEIRGKASLLTPNLEEASLISGTKIATEEDMRTAAREIYSLSRIPCLIKGGHFPRQSLNLLYDGKGFHLFKKKKLKKKVHGTGCFLSSSLLIFLVKGYSLEKACHHALELSHKAIEDAVAYGRGQLLITWGQGSTLDIK
jgi:hydroxymethylpyrimidine/phosphomethylpyrimidine kinase